MTRSKRRNRAQGPISAPSRYPPTYSTASARLDPLDHTAEPSFSDHSTRTLMRTVLGDRTPGLASRFSPVVRSRATGRSRVVTPWEQVRLISPQLTNRAMVCARRTIRREVLFALKGTGKGSKSPRRPKSKVRC